MRHQIMVLTFYSVLFSCVLHHLSIDYLDIIVYVGYSPRAALSNPVYLGAIHCSGNELTVLDCSYKFKEKDNFDHSKDIGIQCNLCKYSYMILCTL